MRKITSDKIQKQAVESEGYNIIIRPDEKVRSIAIELSKRLNSSFDCYFVLGRDIHPHITLFLAQFPVKNLDKLRERVSKIASSHSTF